jgi:predicted dehydrogenase
MGLIGGGPGSFIGPIHRIAAELDGEAVLVAGAFSSSPERSREAGAAYGVDAARAYASFEAMIEAESARAEGDRIDYAAIATPNHMHFEPARRCLEAGFDVIVDKPMCFSLDEALRLKDIVERTGRVLAVTYTYSGYPMVRQARALVAAGRIGRVRKIHVEYSQGWLSTRIEDGQKQAAWRTDPARSGQGGAIGDIGTHAAHLAEYVGGLRISAIAASLETFVENRRLDDDCMMLLRFENGASGSLIATQIAAGEENNLRIRIYGEKGAIEWQQHEPNSLIVRSLAGPIETWRAGASYLDASAAANTRTPPGHPEGYLEAFANLYRAFHAAVRERASGLRGEAAHRDFPSVDDGVRGMAFVEAVMRSAPSDQKWTPFA